MKLPTPGVSEYLTPLRAEHLCGKWWRLTYPLIYYSALVDDIIATPTDFVLDFASVPRMPIAYWLFGSRANAPAGTHDDLYRSGKYPRNIADLIFLEALKVDWERKRPESGAGILLPAYDAANWLGRGTMYSFVWGFGRWSYKATPGCLDPRRCRRKYGVQCEHCEHFSESYFKMSSSG